MSKLSKIYNKFTISIVPYKRNKLLIIGLSMTIIPIMLALFAPYITSYEPRAISGKKFLPPGSKNHLLGTDHLGHDILTDLIYGSRTSLKVGLLATFLTICIGVPIGVIAGFYGGWIDELLMRIAEIFLILPRFLLALLVVAIFEASILDIIFVISILSWPVIARLIRAEFLSIKELPYVKAAIASGAKDVRIILREILPNSLAPSIVQASLFVAEAILIEASLSFLGIGDPNVVSWGNMLQSANIYLRRAWWTVTFPGCILFMTTMGIALISDGLNIAFNPRLRGLSKGKA